MTDHLNALRSIVDEEATRIIELRRTLHRNPELGWDERATTATVAAALDERGITHALRSGSTGLTADVGAGEAAVAFRADLDALPIDEQRMSPYQSQNPGVMHACGHDAHTAIGVGIATVLSRYEGLPGRVRFVFQPAEERIPGGARAMSDDGAIDGASAILAFHVDPSIAPGSVGLRTDAITGASDRLSIELTGPGGHTSRPHQTADLVYAAAKLVLDLPSHLQRLTDPRRPIAVVFGRIAGGAAENVIPSHISLGGTIRLFDLEIWRTLPPRIERLVHEIVEPLGATAKVEYEQGSPPVVNDPGVIDVIRSAAEMTLGSDSILPTEQSLGSEDFSWFLDKAPGALIRLGSALPDRRVDLHSANFDIDEHAIPTGMLMGAMALIRLLERVGA